MVSAVQLVQKIRVVYVYISYYLILMLFRLVQWAHGKINNDHTDYFKGQLGLRSPREKKLKNRAPKSYKMEKGVFWENNFSLMHPPTQWTNLPPPTVVPIVSPLSFLFSSFPYPSLSLSPFSHTHPYRFCFLKKFNLLLNILSFFKSIKFNPLLKQKSKKREEREQVR